MNKQISVAFLIIVSILLLALKDSTSLIHTILHYIPNNSWHQHDDISSHRINPLKIHTYLQHKHSHEHNAHTHEHDVMDHIHHDETESNHPSPSKQIKTTIKIDCYFQSQYDFHLYQCPIDCKVNHFSKYIGFIRNRGITPPYQPPQV